MADIKKVKVGTTEYDITALNILDTDGTTLHSWSDITAMATAAKLNIIVVTTLPTASENTLNAIYLVADTHSDTKDYYDEYITLKSGTSEPYTYEWEKIGNTDVDLTGYVQKGVDYSAAAKSSGEHTHTVTGSVSVPTVSDTHKYLTASVSDTAIGADGTASVLTGVKVKTTDEVLGTGTSFKTPSTQLSGATASVPTKIDTTKFSGGTLTGGNFTPGSAASLNMSVSTAGVLSIDFTPNTVSSFSAIDFTPASLAKGFYTAGSANVVGSIPAMTVQVGTEDKVSAVTGIEGDGTATALTGVKVTTQPTITLTANSTTSTGAIDYVSDVSTATTTATITGGTAKSAGAHTHDVNVAK